MTEKQSEALWLAELLEKAPAHTLEDGTITLYLGGTVVADRAAAELRRLHAENEALRAQIGQGEPVAAVVQQEPVYLVKSSTGASVWVQVSQVEYNEAVYFDVVKRVLYTHPAPQQKPLTDEQDHALCEAYCNAASDEYFKARPQLDSSANRRIFYAGHRKAWIDWQAAHNIGEKK